MASESDVILFGSGAFAARILFDLAATGPAGLSVTVVGRDPVRLAWLRTAAMARTVMFGRNLRVDDCTLASFSTESVGQLLRDRRPRVVANTASIQGGRTVTDKPDPWTQVTREAGLGVTAVLQAKLSLDISAAMASAAPSAFFVNCCYPDVVNAMIAAAGRPIASGIGNVAILAQAFAGALAPERPRLHLLAQHAALSAFRREAHERAGKAPLRLWIAGEEVTDIYTRFAAVKLASEPVIDISGASGAPLIAAMALGDAWNGHAPGPNGLPGGYPVRLADGKLTLDLPPGLEDDAAIAWNRAFEEANGVVVGDEGFVRYTGKVEAALRRISATLAAGFAMRDFDAVFADMSALRARLREG